jgi:glycosyltransferase involved in cell wall biosynthesis
MKISVVIPSYNQGRYIEQALLSVFRQDVRPYEIFVLDGGSTDQTLDVIEKYSSRLTWWRSEKDAGQAAALNEGIAMATGDWICWINSDDGLLPRAFRCVAQATAPDCSIVTGGALWINADVSKLNLYPAVTNIKVDDFRDGATPVNQPSTFFRKCVWTEVGGVNESLHYALDYDFFLRALTRGFKVKTIKAPLAFNRVHQQSKTASGKLQEELDIICKKHFKSAARPYPRGNVEKFGLELLVRFPWWFLIGCILKRNDRIASAMPGLPISQDSSQAHEIRAFLT